MAPSGLSSNSCRERALNVQTEKPMYKTYWPPTSCCWKQISLEDLGSRRHCRTLETYVTGGPCLAGSPSSGSCQSSLVNIFHSQKLFFLSNVAGGCCNVPRAVVFEKHFIVMNSAAPCSSARPFFLEGKVVSLCKIAAERSCHPPLLPLSSPVARPVSSASLGLCGSFVRHFEALSRLVPAPATLPVSV